MLPVSGLHGLFVAFMEETAKIDFSDLQQRFKRVTQPPAGRLLARRWGGSADPEHFNTEGWRRPTARGTQKERHAYSVSFFLVERPQPTMNTLRNWSGHPQAPPQSRPAGCHQL